MALALRWYQSEAIAAIYDYFSKYSGNPIVALPTGTGKSIVIAEFLRGMFCAWPASRAMMLTHVEELIEQNHEELKALWPSSPTGIFSAGLGKKEVRPITFGGIKTVVSKGSLFGQIDIVLIYECHFVRPEEATSYQLFISELRAVNPKVKVIGLTATPYRLGQGLLTEPTERNGKTVPSIFSDICYDITKRDDFGRLIREGVLAPLVPKRTGVQIDVSQVDIRGGEFVSEQLQAAVDRDEITYAAISELVHLGHDRKHWLIFGTGTKHCEHIVSALDSFGISAACVHSKTSKEDRRENVRRFKAGEIRALVNNAIFIAGFNFKPIDLIGDLQPTTSASRHVQKYGRGTRPSLETGKADCLVLDFAGNVKRNGPINDPVIPKRKGKKLDGEVNLAPVKLCMTCSTWNHASKKVCEHCGGEFPVLGSADPKINPTASTDVLIVGAPPIEEVFAVDRVEYRKHLPHHTSDKPPSLKVDYFCGLRQFTEWICLEHIGFASKKAREWWREMANDWNTEPPATVDDALTRLAGLQRPTHLRVWVNTKHPKIQAHDFSGTAFGTVKPKF